MKMTQAWGWLTAGVLAAGMNASYHNGGLQWAHQVADRVERGSSAVLALAAGRADQFLSEARLLTARDESASCPLSTTLARVQTRIAQTSIARSQARVDVMSAREKAQLARLEANRERMEAQIEAQVAHLRIATSAFAPVDFKSIPAPVVCPRVRVNMPRLPRIKMPVMPVTPVMPVIHIETGSAGSV
jgi:hypothetical protein